MPDPLHQVFHDFDGYLGTLPDTEREHFELSFSRSGDPERKKLTYSNRLFVQQETGADPKTVADHWPEVSKRFAHDRYGLDGEFNENELHARIRNELEGRRVDGEFRTEVATRAISDALASPPDMDFIRPYAAALDEFRTSGGEGFDEGKVPEYLDSYRSVFQQTRERLSGALEDIDFAVFLGDELLNGDENRLNSLVSTLSKLDPQDQDLAMAALVKQFERQGVEPRTFLNKLGESFSRGVGGITDSGVLKAELGRIEDELEEHRRRDAGESTRTSPLRHPDTLAEQKARLLTRQRLKAVIDGQIDPLESANVFAQGLIDFSRSAPFTVMALGATAVNPLAGVAVASQLSADARFDEIMLQNPETDPRVAARVANVQGVADGAVETVSNLFLVGKLPGVSAAVNRLGSPARFAMTGTGAVAAEFTEEIVQDSLAVGIREVANAFIDEIPNLQGEGFADILSGENLERTFFAVLPMAVLGVAGNEGARLMRPEAVEQLVTDEAILAAAMRDPEAVRAVQEAQTIEGKVEAFQQGFDGQKAQAEVLARSEDALAELDERQADPGRPTVARNTDGTATVTTPDGQTVQTSGLGQAESVVASVDAGTADLVASTQADLDQPVANAQQPLPPDTEFVQPGAPVTRHYGPGASSAAEWRQRNFFTRFTGDERVTPETADLLPERAGAYIPITNADTAAEAMAKIEENGVVSTANQVMDRSSDMSFPLRVMTGELLNRQIEEQIETLVARRAAGEAELARDIEELSDLSSDLALDLAALGTELGQGVQAFAAWARLNPDGTIAKIERQIRGAKEKSKQKFDGLSKDQKKTARDMLKEINKAPQGFIRANKVRQLNAWISRTAGVPAMDVLTAIWYANILSGINTQTINAFGSGFHLFARGAAAAVASPRDSGALLRGMVSGASDALTEARSVMRGEEVVRGEVKYEQKNLPLEALSTNKSKTTRGQLAGNLATALNLVEAAKDPVKYFKELTSFGRWVFRLMQATDAFFYRTAYEGRAHLAASRIARKKAQTSQDFARLFHEELHDTKNEVDAARAQAAQDVQLLGEWDQNDVDRRTYEILEGQRDEILRQETKRFASLVTYTQTPEGLMGHFARGVNNLHTNAVIPTRFGDVSVTRPFIPFVNIVANVASSGLDFTPVGIARAVKGGHLVGTDSLAFTREERIERAIMGVMGTGAASVLFSIARSFIDDDDPPFMITADGPPPGRTRDTLKQTGWKPFTLKIGDAYIAYNETPLAIPFTVFGGILDAMRYRRSFSRKSQREKWAYAVTLSARAFMEAGFLSSVDQVFKMVDGRSDVSQAGLRIAKGFVPAQGMLRDIARLTDPEFTDRDTGGLGGQFLRDIPFAQSVGNRPALNAFGEPVQRDWFERTPAVSRFLSLSEDDPTWSWMAENGLTVSVPRGVTVGVTSPTKGQKRALERVKLDREKDLGRAWAGVLTAEEHYEFLEMSGPRIKDFVERLRARAGDAEPETLQQLIDREVDRVRKDVKLEMLGIGRPRKRADKTRSP